MDDKDEYVEPSDEEILRMLEEVNIEDSFGFPDGIDIDSSNDIDTDFKIDDEISEEIIIEEVIDEDMPVLEILLEPVTQRQRIIASNTRKIPSRVTGDGFHKKDGKLFT